MNGMAVRGLGVKTGAVEMRGTYMGTIANEMHIGG